jgi:hypothetical protein
MLFKYFKIALTLGSFKIILKPALTVVAFAVPPTSKKLAGSPPDNLIAGFLILERLF